ncbi:MAG: hypothetical protein H0Z24_03020 [Thermosipho sp. (in: Bacteria)]|nr:hypothetical protein [Thermosipho sp. (in: thermotogales)]
MTADSFYSAEQLNQMLSDATIIGIVKKFYDEGVPLNEKLAKLQFQQGYSCFDFAEIFFQSLFSEVRVAENEFRIEVVVLDFNRIPEDRRNEAYQKANEIGKRCVGWGLQKQGKKLIVYYDEEMLFDMGSLAFIDELFDLYMLAREFDPQAVLIKTDRNNWPKEEEKPATEVTIKLGSKGDITIISNEGNVTRKNKIGPAEFLAVIQETFQETYGELGRKFGVKTPVLPQGTVAYKESVNNEKYAVALLVSGKKRWTAYFKDRFQVPYPNLIFFLEVESEKITNSTVVAVKDTVINRETQLFHYPFSNVYSNTKICWGTIGLGDFKIKEPRQLEMVPELFFGAENNNDLYVNKKPLRQLFEELETKEVFPIELLRPIGIDFQSYFDSFGE